MNKCVSYKPSYPENIVPQWLIQDFPEGMSQPTIWLFFPKTAWKLKKLKRKAALGNNYCPQNEVWGKVIFSQASVCPRGRGVCIPACNVQGCTPPETHPLDRHPWTQTPSGKHPLVEMTIEVGGMHSTGMHAFFFMTFLWDAWILSGLPEVVDHWPTWTTNFQNFMTLLMCVASKSLVLPV